MNDVYDSLRLLVQFVNGTVSLGEFLNKSFLKPNKTERKRLDELPEESRLHEKCHGDVWQKYGILYYFCIENGKPGTAPEEDSLYDYIKSNKMDNNRFMEMYYKVVTAPERAGLALGFSDRWSKRVLNREFKNLSDFASAYAAENCC
ncbi:MAG: hypothetical protein Q8L37_01180 [Candidatus Gottesmanbacteria bacterium]|nr:hypothetical protein [Candidatus Gottesmanbacteria bacterium]